MWWEVGKGGGGEVITSVSHTERELKIIKGKAMDYLNKAGEGLRSEGAIVKIKVGIGNTAEEIINTADEIDADWIAMSTHGWSGITRWAFSSVTDKVLRGGNKPMLVVRASKEAGKV